MDSGQIIKLCDSLLHVQGFECHPFLIGWYNSSLTSDRFRLPYNDDALAVLVISVPRMFETTFLPWLRERKQNLGDIFDPVDECMREVFAEFRKKLTVSPSLQVEIIQDFEMMGRYPRILMNTAGHVSGAAYYYQKSELDDGCMDKKLHSVSVHPKYGGWFAFRAIIIFPQHAAPDLPKRLCEKSLTSKESVHNLMHSYTNEWRKNEWRNLFVTAEEKYSPMQEEYFSRPPRERKELLKTWVEQGKI